MDIKRELKKALKVDFILAKNGGIKNLEVSLQDTIEKFFIGKIWWEVCDINIFFELLEIPNKTLYNYYEILDYRDALINKVVDACFK